MSFENSIDTMNAKLAFNCRIEDSTEGIQVHFLEMCESGNSFEALAFVRFCYMQDESGARYMELLQTPQGVKLSTLSSTSTDAKKEFMKLNFRTSLLKAAIDIAKQQNCQFIKVVSARNSSKVVHTEDPYEIANMNGYLTRDVAYKIIDTPCLEVGFRYQQDDNLYFRISTITKKEEP